MPYSFTQIEKDKSASIGFVFSFLIFFYFFVLAGLSILIKCFGLSFSSSKIVLRLNVFGPFEWFVLISISVITAFLHYYITLNNLSPRLLKWMGAKEPDPSIENQNIFINILEEISAATGGLKFHGLIIPESSMNVFAVDDQEHTPAIGITEGALHRLTRQQLEAVVAHEVAHILKGDCSNATMVSAIFEFYTMPIKQLIRGRKKALTEDIDIDGRFFGDLFRILFRLGPGALFFMIAISTFYLVTSVLALTMRIFISREAKFRADAIAVRLTRDPVSLAQAIRLLAENWRGVGSEWESLEGIFFVNPYPGSLDESEGFFSNLFSTHPPIHKRISVLLDMAHFSAEDLEQSVSQQIKEFKDADQGFTGMIAPSARWLLQKNEQWYGPFSLFEVGRIDWITLQTPCKMSGNEQVISVQDDANLRIIAINKSKVQKNLCPVCRVPLEEIIYENKGLKTCYSCQGALVKEDDISVIMNRKQAVLSEASYQLARSMMEGQVDQNINWHKISQGQNQNGFICPQCANHMHTRLFNSFYPVAVDKCLNCGSIWFEQGELDLIQALYELKNPS